MERKIDSEVFNENEDKEYAVLSSFGYETTFYSNLQAAKGEYKTLVGKGHCPSIMWRKSESEVEEIDTCELFANSLFKSIGVK